MASQSHQEIELKRLLLGERAADRLVSALGPVASDVTQTNHFFDTSDGRLRQQRFSLRLRDEDGRFFLTAKAPSRGVGGSATARTEAESELDATAARQILAGALDPLATLRQRPTAPAFGELWRGLDAAREGRPLHHAGSFQNRRRVVVAALSPALTVRVEVDQTHLPGGRVDEEAEIELPDAELCATVEAWLEERAARAGIQTAASSSKLGRFYAALEQQRGER